MNEEIGYPYCFFVKNQDSRFLKWLLCLKWEVEVLNELKVKLDTTMIKDINISNLFEYIAFPN